MAKLICFVELYLLCVGIFVGVMAMVVMMIRHKQ